MQEQDKSSWRIAKEVPISVILVLVAQTIGVIWWAAALAAKVDAVNTQIVFLSTSTTANAAGVNELNSLRNLEQDRRILLLETQIRELQQVRYK